MSVLDSHENSFQIIESLLCNSELLSSSLVGAGDILPDEKQDAISKGFELRSDSYAREDVPHELVWLLEYGLK